jgi:methylation protein EvaC
MGIINKSKEVGEFRHYEVCRFCSSENITPVIDLGYVPLAGGFLKNKKEFKNEKFYPLVVVFCNDCFLLQVNAAINPDTLFKNYFYFSSSIKTLLDHFELRVQDLKNLLPNPKKSLVVEIGANDGGFINSLQNHGYKALGVDPATNIVRPLIKKGLPMINNYFTEKVAEEIVQTHGKADAIYGFHSMAHIEDMHEVLRGVKTLLKDDGFLAIEVHYLGSLINEYQFDMIYHEHQYYYSLIALQNFFSQYDMEVFDVQRFPVRGGSILFFVQNKKNGKQKISAAVKKLRTEEIELGFDTAQAYKKYAKYIEKIKLEMQKLVEKLKKQNKTIAGYGASGRGTILSNYCGLTEKYLDYVIDDAPAKQGAFTPGTRLQITSSEILQSKKMPDFVVLFAWPFITEIKKKQTMYLQNGGRFIVPLPDVSIVSV